MLGDASAPSPPSLMCDAHLGGRWKGAHATQVGYSTSCGLFSDTSLDYRLRALSARRWIPNEQRYAGANGAWSGMSVGGCATWGDGLRGLAMLAIPDLSDPRGTNAWLRNSRHRRGTTITREKTKEEREKERA